MIFFTLYIGNFKSGGSEISVLPGEQIHFHSLNCLTFFFFSSLNRPWVSSCHGSYDKKGLLQILHDHKMYLEWMQVHCEIARHIHPNTDFDLKLAETDGFCSYQLWRTQPTSVLCDFSICVVFFFPFVTIHFLLV